MSPSRLLMETSKLAEKVKLQKLIEDSTEANFEGTSVWITRSPWCFFFLMENLKIVDLSKGNG